MLMNISSSTSAMDRDTCNAFTYLPPEGSDYSDNDSFFSEIETILLPYIDTCKHFYITRGYPEVRGQIEYRF